MPLADLKLKRKDSTVGTFLNHSTGTYEAVRFRHFSQRFSGSPSWDANTKEQLPIDTMAWLALRYDSWNDLDGILIAENGVDIYRFNMSDGQGQRCNGIQYTLLNIREERNPDAMLSGSGQGNEYYAIGSDLRARGII